MTRPRLAAHQFGDVGILLLRHDRGAGTEAIRQLDEAELLAVHSTSSSDQRDRCIMHRLAAAQNSIAKSRSLTASSEFSLMPLETQQLGAT